MLVSKRFDCTEDGPDPIPFLAVFLGLLLAPPSELTAGDQEAMQDRPAAEWPADVEDVGGDHAEYLPEITESASETEGTSGSDTTTSGSGGSRVSGSLPHG